MRRPQRHALDRAAGRDQRLADDLSAEHPLPPRLRRAAAKQVQFERFEIEDINQFLDGGGHAVSRCAGAVTAAAFVAYGIGRGVKAEGRHRRRQIC